MESTYLEFEQVADTGKTKVWNVYSKNRGDFLAEIKWYGSWRQYAFFPRPGTIWNAGCLSDVNDFIAEQMAARKNA